MNFKFQFFRGQWQQLIITMLVVLFAFGCTKSNTETLVDEALSQSDNGQIMEGSIGTQENPKIKAQWRKVKSFKDTKSKKTETFKITGGEWKISWKTKPKKKKGSEFIIMLYDKKHPDAPEVIANVTGSDDDFTTLEGKGAFYLDIKTKQPYEIKIEELK